MKKRLFMFIMLLLVLPFVIAACGDDDNADEEQDNNEESSSLSESYTAEASGLVYKVNLPEGWVGKVQEGGIVLGNNQAALDLVVPEGARPTSGQHVIIMLPVAKATVGDVSMDDLATQMSNQTDAEVESLTLGGHDTRLGKYNDEGVDGWIYIMDFADNYIMIISGTTTGEGDRIRDATNEILSTLTVETAS
ncbi:MAG: hypothetical protein K8I82_03540 [Anaerolineae bacterium]|nr:hypothetical protein [Anaerolineae bacterium]